MATAVVTLVGSAVINAVAFSGSNYMFSMLHKNEIDQERQRHDLAIEMLEKQRATWTQKRTERLDWLNSQLKEENDAKYEFADLNAAMREYARVKGKNLEPFETEPTINDFYHPSKTQQYRELIFIGASVPIMYFGAKKIWSYFI